MNIILSHKDLTLLSKQIIEFLETLLWEILLWFAMCDIFSLIF